jgi:hypothetical protein
MRLDIAVFCGKLLPGTSLTLDLENDLQLDGDYCFTVLLKKGE